MGCKRILGAGLRRVAPRRLRKDQGPRRLGTLNVPSGAAEPRTSLLEDGFMMVQSLTTLAYLLFHYPASVIL
jgi:hypothetical protein